MKSSRHLLSALLLPVFLLQSNCTLSEFGSKTKDGITKSASFVSSNSQKAYQSGKAALGLAESQKPKLKPMTVAKKAFGEMPDGSKVSEFVLTNAHGMQVSLLDYGATVKDNMAPDRNGVYANVSLGFGNLKDYRRKALISDALPDVMPTESPRVLLPWTERSSNWLPTTARITFMEESGALTNTFGPLAYRRRKPPSPSTGEARTEKRGTPETSAARLPTRLPMTTS